MAGSVFDEGTGRVPGIGALPGQAGRAGHLDGIGTEPAASQFDDVEVVDGFGMPVLPPDHTED
ncbi:hypothetical protein, partial [Myceligenerans halotolerans]